MAKRESAEKAIKDIRRKTRRRFSAEEKIRIVMEGLRGEDSIAELCRREGLYSSQSKFSARPGNVGSRTGAVVRKVVALSVSRVSPFVPV